MKDTEAQIGIIAASTKCIFDPRRSASVVHQLNELIEQRVYQITCGYEDANDSNSFRNDPTLKISVGRLPESGLELASQPTISRLENQISSTDLYRMAIVFVEHFLNSYEEAPSIIVLDFDDTANIVHGYQQMALFNGYYRETCCEPMHLYEALSGKLIASILRPGRRPLKRFDANVAWYYMIALGNNLFEAFKENVTEASSLNRFMLIPFVASS